MTATITCAGCQHAYIATALFCPNCGRPRAREALADPLLGKVLGERFLVQDLLGQGGSGTIYRAEHVTLRRKVAIKVLHNELSRDDLAVERFRREATTVAEIDNEHIVEIHDFGRTPDGRLYLAMELLEGETLDVVLARDKQLSVERTADVLIQVGEALMEAHAIGYVHRDLRPRNIYLAVRRGKANFIKLLDFGLAKLVETEGQAASTSLGMTFGDPRYMSPEQARGDRIDRRADIYQLGCVAYEMMTGAPPFSGNRVFDILTKQVTEIPQPLPTRRPGVPLWMEAAVTKMLAKDPENRFATTTRMVEALRRGLETGEVMEDDVARRRESIPPPSVSRVMQRLGMQPGDPPPAAPVLSSTVPAPLAPAPVTAGAVPAPSVTGGSVPAPAMPASVPTTPASAPGTAPAASVPSPLVPGALVPGALVPGALVPGGTVPAPGAPRSGASAPAGVPGSLVSGASASPPALRTGIPPVEPGATMRAPIAPPPAKPDSVELLRKRTGTPRIGVPILDPVVLPAQARVALPAQPPVAGVIEPVVAAPSRPLTPAAPVVSAQVGAAPVAAERPASASSGGSPAHREGSAVLPPATGDGQPRGKPQKPATGELNISQLWYDEGDRLSRDPSRDDDDGPSRTARSRKLISPSHTDLSYYDEPPRRRWGLIAGLGAFAVIGGFMVFALTRGSSSEPSAAAPPAPVAAAGAAIDPASKLVATEPPPPPSQIVSPDSGSAAKPAPADTARAAAPPPSAPARPAAAPRHAAEPRAPEPRAETRAPVSHRNEPSYPVLGSEPTRRAPAPPAITPAGPNEPARAPSAPRLTDAPKDPYSAADEAPSDAAPDRKAEFYANLGGQQLIGGDTAGAASSFKKALELDGKNVAAVMGMGEIALRQGLFGDAIAHLSRASKLAPKNSKALTLLGEAYLNSGNNAQAAAQFKKALQLDPDNARARDGYNEASSRVPPPDDDSQ